MGKGRIYKCVDSLDGIDLSTVSLAHVRWHTGSGIAIPPGAGRDRKYRCRNGGITDIGDIEEHIWYQLAGQIARCDHEMWLVDTLAVWEGAQLPPPFASPDPGRSAGAILHAELRPAWVGLLCPLQPQAPAGCPGWRAYRYRDQRLLQEAGRDHPGADRPGLWRNGCLPPRGRWSEFSIASGEDPPREEF